MLVDPLVKVKDLIGVLFEIFRRQGEGFVALAFTNERVSLLLDRHH